MRVRQIRICNVRGWRALHIVGRCFNIYYLTMMLGSPLIPSDALALARTILALLNPL